MVTLSTYLPTINFKNAVIVALDWEGLSTTDDLLDLEEDDVKNLFKIIKTPGGQILNPAYIPPSGTPAVVPAIYLPQFIQTPEGEIPNPAYVPPARTPAIVTRGASAMAPPAVLPAIYIPQYIPAVGINVP